MASCGILSDDGPFHSGARPIRIGRRLLDADDRPFDSDVAGKSLEDVASLSHVVDCLSDGGRKPSVGVRKTLVDARLSSVDAHRQSGALRFATDDGRFEFPVVTSQSDGVQGPSHAAREPNAAVS
jgi:hypothetical protein